MRRSFRGGALLTCDAGTCSQAFVTHSMTAFARPQARFAGWDRVPAWQITDLDSPRRKYDVCPRHATVAATHALERDEAIAKRKADRIKLKRAILTDATKASKTASATKTASRTAKGTP